MPQSRTQFAILSLLRLGPMTGYEIREFCRTRFSYFWKESFGQIYPTLNRLGDERKIQALDVSDKRGTRYELTDLGRNSLVGWLHEPPAPRVVRDELFLKLFCGGEALPSVHLDHIADARRVAKAELKELNAAVRELDELAAGHPDFTYWKLILRAGLLILEARLRWYEEAESELRKMNK